MENTITILVLLFLVILAMTAFVMYICSNPLLTVVFNTFMKSITFGKRLTEVRKDKKMSQDEVGKLVGVHVLSSVDMSVRK